MSTATITTPTKLKKFHKKPFTVAHVTNVNIRLRSSIKWNRPGLPKQRRAAFVLKILAILTNIFFHSEKKEIKFFAI